jgi:hypothetical protein
VTQQTARVIGSYAYGHVAVDKERESISDDFRMSRVDL